MKKPARAWSKRHGGPGVRIAFHRFLPLRKAKLDNILSTNNQNLVKIDKKVSESFSTLKLNFWRSRLAFLEQKTHNGQKIAIWRGFPTRKLEEALA